MLTRTKADGRTPWPRILQEGSLIHNAQPNAGGYRLLAGRDNVWYPDETNIDTTIPSTEPYEDCPDIDSYYERVK